MNNRTKTAFKSIVWTLKTKDLFLAHKPCRDSLCIICIMVNVNLVESLQYFNEHFSNFQFFKKKKEKNNTRLCINFNLLVCISNLWV